MLMPGRNDNATEAAYRYAFNGMTADKEIKGERNNYDYGARMYDPRIGKWFSVDVYSSKYTSQSPYNFSVNSPLLFKDPNGKNAIVTITEDESGKKTITFSTTIYITGKGVSDSDVQYIKDVFEQNYKNVVFSGKDADGEDADLIYVFNIVDARPNSREAIPSVIAQYVNSNLIDNEQEIKSKAKGSEDMNGNLTGLEHGENLLILNAKKTSNSVTRFSASQSWIKKDSGNDLAFEVVHEVFHLMGLSDRYILKIGEKRDPHEGFEGTVMGGGYENIWSLVLHQNNINASIQSGIEIYNNTNNSVTLNNGEKVQTIYKSVDTAKKKYLDDKDSSKKPANIEGYD